MQGDESLGGEIGGWNRDISSSCPVALSKTLEGRRGRRG